MRKDSVSVNLLGLEFLAKLIQTDHTECVRLQECAVQKAIQQSAGNIGNTIKGFLLKYSVIDLLN